MKQWEHAKSVGELLGYRVCETCGMGLYYMTNSAGEIVRFSGRSQYAYSKAELWKRAVNNGMLEQWLQELDEWTTRQSR